MTTTDVDALAAHYKRVLYDAVFWRIVENPDDADHAALMAIIDGGRRDGTGAAA